MAQSLHRPLVSFEKEGSMRRHRSVHVIHGFQIMNNGRRLPWSKPKFHVNAIATFIIFAMVAIVALSGCGGNDKPPIPTITKTPSREDIIQAVRRSVEGKTYRVMTERQESKLHTCTQFDVDLDPYMPHNPELAKCPYVGKTYTTWETVAEPETRTCKPLPGPEYGWQVEKLDDDRWRVSLSGSVWDVEKLDGASASAGEYIKVSSFTFAIQGAQDC